MVVVGSGVLSSMGTTGTTQLIDKVDSPASLSKNFKLYINVSLSSPIRKL